MPLSGSVKPYRTGENTCRTGDPSNRPVLMPYRTGLGKQTRFFEDLSLSCWLQLRYPGRGTFYVVRGRSSEDKLCENCRDLFLNLQGTYPRWGTVHPRPGESRNRPGGHPSRPGHCSLCLRSACSAFFMMLRSESGKVQNIKVVALETSFPTSLRTSLSNICSLSYTRNTE